MGGPPVPTGGIAKPYDTGVRPLAIAAAAAALDCQALSGVEINLSDLHRTHSVCKDCRAAANAQQSSKSLW